VIVNSIHCTFAPKDADEVETLFRELRDASLSEPEVGEFQVGRSVEKPNVFALWEVYRDREALDAHRTTDHLRSTRYQSHLADGTGSSRRDRDSDLTEVHEGGQYRSDLAAVAMSPDFSHSRQNRTRLRPRRARIGEWMTVLQQIRN